MYLGNRKIVIVDIIPFVGLVKVCYADEMIKNAFWVDKKSISKEPCNDPTISLDLFKGSLS